MDRTYNSRTGRYEFSNSNTMSFGNSLSIAYRVDEITKDITFGRGFIHASYLQREMNTVLLELEKLMIAHHIANDIDNALNEEVLADFTVAQISTFIEMSAEYKAPKCTAWLLDYKNKRYPNYEEYMSFTLDL